MHSFLYHSTKLSPSIEYKHTVMLSQQNTWSFWAAFSCRTCTSWRPKRTSGRRRTSKRRKSSGTWPRFMRRKTTHGSLWEGALGNLLGTHFWLQLGPKPWKSLEYRWRILSLHGSFETELLSRAFVLIYFSAAISICQLCSCLHKTSFCRV